MSNFTSNGGGATHVAKVTGQLSSLSSNLSDILMVSGGGGGGFITPGSSDLQPYIDKLKSTTCGASNQYSLLYWNLNRDGSRGANLPNIYSFITPTGNFNINATTYESIYFCTVGTVDITNNGGGSIIADYDFVNAPNDCVSISYQTMYGDIKTKKGNYGFTVRQWSDNYLTLDDLLNISTIPSFTTSFNTMEACLQYLTQHFRHINVTVNGIPWEAYLNHVYSGADAGGISGSGTKSANQSTGYAFGQGESGIDVSGGGAGLYGGYKGVTDPGVPSAVATYLNKLASFTAHTNDGRDLSMLYYIDAGPYRNYDLTRPYSATYIWSYDNGSFNFVNGRVYEFMLFDNGRLNLTVDSTTGATTLSFSGFATPSQMPIVYQSNGYNYAYGLGWIGGRLSVSTLGTSAFDGTRYTTSFNSVAACLSYCADHFRNVEVYVNGVAWVTIDDTKYAHLIIPLSGGAGSGYIGNEFLSNKKMVGFNVPTSSAASTKTESVQTCNIAPYADTPKVRNGFVTIKFLGIPAGTYTLDTVIKIRNMTHYQATPGDDINALSNYFGTDYVLITNSTSIGDLEYSSIQGGYFRLPMESNTMIYVPISKLENVINARFGGITELYSGEFYVGVAKIVKNKMVIIDHSQLGCRWTGYSYRDLTLDHETIDYIILSGGYAFGYHCVSSFIEFTKEN